MDTTKGNTGDIEITAQIKKLLGKGDRKSAAALYAQLVKRYSLYVIDFADRLVCNRADAEELAQNAFVKAFNGLQTFEGRAAFLTWICRIAYNEAVSHLKRKKHFFVSIDDTQVADTEIDDGDLSTGDEERIQQLEAAIDLIPPDEQTLLHLYYYEDKPIKEIAFIMSTDENTLRVRLYRIRRKLAGMIKFSH